MPLATFPTLVGLSWPAKRAPVWSTDRHSSASGKQTGYALWAYPRWAYELTYDLLRSDIVNIEFQQLVGFFNSVHAGADVWKFHDPDDGTADVQGFGIGNGVDTVFQLVRSLGGFTEPVILPVVASVVVQVDGVDTAATISTAGVVTFGGPPANAKPLTWSGDYDWLCRFDSDRMDFEKFMQDFWNAGSVAFTTELA